MAKRDFFAGAMAVDYGTWSLHLDATGTAFTADRTLLLDVGNSNRTLALAGNLTLANNFTTAGNFPVTLTATATTTVTLPTSGTLAVTGSNTFTGNQSINAAGSTSSGSLVLGGSTMNWIDFSTNGVAAPAFTTRSAGTKIVLYNAEAVAAVDYAIGVETGNVWFSTATASTGFKFYAGTTNIATLSGAGQLTLSGGIVATATTQATSDASTNIATTSFVKQMFGTTSGTGTLDWNDVTNTRPGTGPTLLLDTATNGPAAIGRYYHPFNLEYASKDGTGNVTQMAIPYGNFTGELYMRGRYSGAWTSWSRFLSSTNYNSFAPTLTGTGASGTWGIGISGSAAQLGGQAGSYYLDLANATGTLNNGRLSTSTGAYTIDPQIPRTNVPHTTLSGSTIGEMALTAPVTSYTENKLMFVYPTILEYSTDNGANWITHPTAVSSNTVKNMFIGYNAGSVISILGPNNGNWTNVRFTFDSPSYRYLDYLYFYGSTNGHTATVLIEKCYGSDNTTWSTVGSGNWSSWPGHTMIPHTVIPWNPTPTPGTHSRYVRVTFGVSAWNGTYPSNNIDITNILWFGTYPAPTQPNPLFTYDNAKNVGFSGIVNAPSFSGALSGNATSATTAGNVTGTVAVANGGTGAVNASAARTNLSANTFTYGASPPASPNPGDQWLNIGDSAVYTWYNDGTSQQWVDLGSAAVNPQLVTYIGTTQPTDTGNYLWVQTGLGDDGSGVTLWVNA